MNEFPKHLIGRDYLINEICDSVRGNHISIVGPPKNGKTVVLNHLCSTDSVGIKGDIIYWDIGGKTPQDDTELLEQFAKRFSDHPNFSADEYYQAIDFDSKEWTEDLSEFLKEFCAKNPILFIIDGIDYLLDAPSISRIPYGYFTKIADIPGFNFLVSGRKPLHEIVVSEIHVASTWTGRFNPTPKIVGPFIDSDIRAFAKEFQKLHQVVFPEDVAAEILKQTGGNPLLVKELLEGILKDVPSGNSSLNKPLVKKISKKLSDGPSMWNRLVRLPDERKAILAAVLNEPDTSTFPRGCSREIDRLKSEGLIEETDTNKLRLSCEMIRPLIPELQTENQGYVDSFAKKEDYNNNIWRILNFRVKHLEALDFKGSIGLLDNIRHAIDGLKRDPAVALTPLRQIDRLALNVIWENELDPGNEIPKSWRHELGDKNGYNKSKAKEGHKPIDKLLEQFPDWRLNADGRWGEMALLEAAVGAKYGTPKFSSNITEPTYLLINTINKVGDFATHYHDHVKKTLHVDKTPLIDKAYSACQIMVAIELYESLYRDLTRQSSL